MCGHKRVKTSPTGESYDGTTTRLVSGENNERMHGAHRHFPWWTLWLIWPMIALLKGVSISVLAGWAALGELSVPVNLLLALALIAVGVAILVRGRNRAE